MSAIDDTIACIGQLDAAAMVAARERQGTLTKPPGSLGRLEELAVWLAASRVRPSHAPSDAVRSLSWPLTTV